MALTLYLAMTAAEIYGCSQLPEKIAYMACHFSPYGSGLSNLPSHLPAGSVLILNDRIPPQGHDPQAVATQLSQVAEKWEVGRILLDMQRPGDPQTTDIVKAILDTCPCPAAVTPAYADDFDCPVFLTPQLRQPLQEQLTIWRNRRIWLEALPECQMITVTEQGSQIFPATLPSHYSGIQTDEELHCHYHWEEGDACVQFTVWRDAKLLQDLLAEAETLQVQCAIGLYQQLQEKAAEDI